VQLPRSLGGLPGALLLACSLGACTPGVTLLYATPPQHLAAAASVAQARLRALDVGRTRVSTRDGHLVVEVPAEAREQAKSALEPLGLLRFARVEDGSEKMKRLATSVADDQEAGAMGISSSLEAPPAERPAQLGAEVYLTGGKQRLQKYLAALPPELAAAPGHSFVVEKPPGRSARTYYLDLNGSLAITRVLDAHLVKRRQGLTLFSVEVRLTPEDGAQLLRLTTSLVGKRMAVLLDDTPLIVPRVVSPIPGNRAQLMSELDRERCAWVAAVLAGGALPAPLTLLPEAP
jgi:preprotein translocase subunit SecD